MNKEDNEKILTDIKTKRGWIATNFAYLEVLIGRVITVSYFENGSPVREIFITEVLEDEYFNFGLLVKIFKKVIQRENHSFPIGKLYRLQELRNIVIHSQITTQAQAVGNKIISLGDIEFKHGGKKYVVNKIYEEYDIVENEVRSALDKLPGGSSIKMDL